jgi:hypothetical protein
MALVFLSACALFNELCFSFMLVLRVYIMFKSESCHILISDGVSCEIIHGI